MDIHTYLSEIGRKGGQSRSERKRRASSANLAAARKARAEKKSKKILDKAA